MNTKILVTGASGNLGALVVASLLQKTEANNIAVMLRNAKDAEAFISKEIEVRMANYDNTESMADAFKGIDKLYFVSGSDLEARLVQHKNIVAAAKVAKVGHIVYTSFSRKDGTVNHTLSTLAQGHLIAEEAIMNSGIPYTFLLNNYYMEVIPLFVGKNILTSQTIYFPAQQGKSGFIARKDIAELSAEILTTAGHENKVYEASGEEAYTFDEIAQLISDVSGIKISYISPSEVDFEKALKEYKVPKAGIDISILSARAILKGEFEKTSGTFQKITGHRPTSLSKFLRETYGVNTH
ncbi:SDR family oxidoreductase [Leeuwenhoekiella marinoflava]|nr:SDR family oxidoreductase [Leeuwenhoekiella marinoflava]